MGARLVIAFAILALAGCGHSDVGVPVSQAATPAGGSPVAQPSPVTPELVDIAGVADLQSRFNQDAGSARLILLVSPT